MWRLSVPVQILVFLLLSPGVLQSPPLILFVDLVSRKNVCTNQTRLQIASGEALLSVAESLKANNAISSDTIDEGNDTG